VKRSMLSVTATISCRAAPPGAADIPWEWGRVSCATPQRLVRGSRPGCTAAAVMWCMLQSSGAARTDPQEWGDGDPLVIGSGLLVVLGY